MAHNDGVPVELATATVSDLPLSQIATAAVKALSIVGYRGCVTFQAKNANGSPLWAAVVTFTDDLPDGTWLTTNFS
jgi:hypothetical protein